MSLFSILADASSLIRLLLCPDPVERISIQDVCTHWWINLGYDTTPLEDSGPGKIVDWDSLNQCLTQSSSSEGDSDQQPEGGVDSSQQPIKGILKKPDRKSECEDDEAVFDEEEVEEVDEVEEEEEVASGAQINDGASHTSENQDVNRAETGAVTDTHIEVIPGGPRKVVVFDSQRKPKKSILKNKQRYTGSDSGCIMDETLSVSGGVASDPQPCFCKKEEVEKTPCSSCDSNKDDKDLYDLTDIDDVLSGFDPSGNADIHSAPPQFPGDDSGAFDVDGETSDSNQAPKSSTPTITSAKCCEKCQDAAANPDLSAVFSETGPPSAPIVVTRRKKGILKRNGKFSSSSFDPTWRYSTGSQGSNSSADFLDFSYDSMDGEAFMAEHCGGFTSVDIKLDDITLETNSGMKRTTDDDDDEDSDSDSPPPLPREPPPSHPPRWNSPPPLPSQSPPPYPPRLYDDAELTDLKELLDNNIDCLLPGLSPQLSDENIFCKISRLNCEQSKPDRNGTSDLFDVAEAREVFQQALKICHKLT